MVDSETEYTDREKRKTPKWQKFPNIKSTEVKARDMRKRVTKYPKHNALNI